MGVKLTMSHCQQRYSKKKLKNAERYNTKKSGKRLVGRSVMVLECKKDDGWKKMFHQVKLRLITLMNSAGTCRSKVGNGKKTN